MKIFTISLVILTLCVIPGYSSHVLGFFPSPSKSHLIIHMAVVRSILERGHDVTVITTLPLRYKHPKLRHIILSESSVPQISNTFMKQMLDPPKNRFSNILNVFEWMGFFFSHSNASLHAPEMKEFMNDKNNKIDLLLLGYFFNEFHLGLATYFKCPVIVILINQPVYGVNRLIGNPMELSYVPALLTNFPQPMAFKARLENFLIGGLEALGNIYFRRQMRKYYAYNFPPDKYRSYDDTLRNVSMVFAVHHFSEGPIRPNVPGIVEIGGIHLKEKPDPLPKNLENFLNSANKHGAIYFSFGSNVQASDLNNKTIEIIFNVFTSLKQKIVMKWEIDALPVRAKNIFHDKWLPQDDILSHPNVKLFITHGGYGSIIESKYRGVPIIGMPVFADQHSNMERTRNEGWAVVLNHLNLTEKELKSAIRDVIENSTYRENVKYHSSLYRDRIASPKDTAAFWAEYVLRHRGAPHMQSPAVHMSVFHYCSLDVITFLIVAIVVAVKIIIFVIKFGSTITFKGKTVEKVKQN